MAKKKEPELSQNQKLAAGVGLTAAAVAAAGAYFLYGSKEADKNRKSVKSWALKAKAEVLEKMEDAKKMSKEEYEDVVHAAAGAYAGVKGATKKDLGEFASEMKEHWDVIEGFTTKKKKAVKKTTKKAPKKAAKKAVKKNTRKTTKK